jgi:lipid A 3-O-deacylase
MRSLICLIAVISAGVPVFLPRPAIADTHQEMQNAASGILSEIRIGALNHDANIITTREEDSDIDGNLEFLFASPRFLHNVWAPRPHLGVSANFGGDTSQGYLGLTWDIDLSSSMFAEVSLGASVHNGELDTGDPDRKNLGCRWLFRESVSLGYRITEQHNISVMYDHSSNAELCDRNDGIDSLGIRLGYRF